MQGYRLQQDVPIVWVTDLRRLRQPPSFSFESSELSESVCSSWKNLEAGTLLEASSLVSNHAIVEELGFATVRVDGREGLVELDHLRDALPEWEPHAVPRKGVHRQLTRA